MSSVPQARNLQIEDICREIKTDANRLIVAEEERYHAEIRAVAQDIHARRTNRHIVLLCGPSSSGKTTTAGFLKKELARVGTAAHVVSLDDFYLGKGKAPLLPNGKPDYETIDALNVEQLLGCLEDLVQRGRTTLPIFDFKRHCPADETVDLVLEEDAAVIFEGIHAFNPRLQTYLPAENTHRLFINTLSRFYDKNAVWFSRRQVRLIRRILRDDQFRASPFSNTMQMWPQVVRGENMYLFPYEHSADCAIDTTFAYEPCVMKDLLLPRLNAVPQTDPAFETARELMEKLAVFPSVAHTALPSNSLLKEFTG